MAHGIGLHARARPKDRSGIRFLLDHSLNHRAPIDSPAMKTTAPEPLLVALKAFRGGDVKNLIHVLETRAAGSQ
jgi:hypothetical protein